MKYRHFIGRNPFLSAHILLFFISIVAGLLLYAGKLNGYSDDLCNVGPGCYPTIPAFLRWIFLEWGNAGINLLYIPIRFSGEIFHLTPETFPWWLFSSVDMYCNAGAALNFLFVVFSFFPHLKWEKTAASLFVITVWGLNKVVFQTTIYIPISLFAGYTLPLFLTSVAVLLFNSPLFFNRKKRIILTLVCYGLASVNTPIFLASLPVLLIVQTINHWLARRLDGKMCVRWILIWVSITIGAILFFLLQPGLYNRVQALDEVPELATLVGLSVGERISVWYSGSLYMGGYAMLFGEIGIFKIIHPFFLVSFSILTLAVLFRHYRNLSPLPFSQQILLVCGFLLAFHASTSSLLYLKYFPDRAQVYPALLLALSWVSVTLLVFTFIQKMFLLATPTPYSASIIKKQIYRFVYWGSIFLLYCGIGYLFFQQGASKLTSIIQAYQEEIRYNRIREVIRPEMLAESRRLGKTEFLLIGCPTDIDLPWGWKGYFGWYSIKNAQVRSIPDRNQRIDPTEEQHKIRINCPN